MNVSILTLSFCLQGRVAVADADANEPTLTPMVIGEPDVQGKSRNEIRSGPERFQDAQAPRQTRLDDAVYP